MGEPAEDGGGPRREFFRFALSAVTNDPALFKGPPGRRVPVSSAHALLKRSFFYVGNLIAASISQGGLGPCCFPAWVYEYLCHGLDSCEVGVEDIPNEEKKELVLEVSLRVRDCSMPLV